MIRCLTLGSKYAMMTIMDTITKSEILQLSQLARLDLTSQEATALVDEISDILDYVKVVQDMAESDAGTPTVGTHYNSLREDVVTNEPDEYTEVLLEAAPERYKQFVKVKKILPN